MSLPHKLLHLVPLWHTAACTLNDIQQVQVQANNCYVQKEKPLTPDFLWLNGTRHCFHVVPVDTSFFLNVREQQSIVVTGLAGALYH